MKRGTRTLMKGLEKRRHWLPAQARAFTLQGKTVGTGRVMHTTAHNLAIAREHRRGRVAKGAKTYRELIKRYARK